MGETLSDVDPAFGCIPAGKSSFFMWRVVNLALERVPVEEYGKLYKGDAYLVYCASSFGTQGGPHMPVEQVHGSLDVHIHFWLGSESSIDEGAVSAIKSVELDTFLGGAPVQQRETEGHESKRFASYFKEGIRYLSGGTASGLKHVTDEHEPAMYHVKGKRQVRVHQLPKVSWDYMNDGDVYVIAATSVVYCWVGGYSNNIERLKGAKFARTLMTETDCIEIMVIIEDGRESTLTGTERTEFEELLPLTKKKIKRHSEVARDEEVARQLGSEIRLYRCSDDSGTLKVEEIKEGPLLQSDLSSSDAFIIDNGSAGVWVWIGKKASQKERSEAMRNAAAFVGTKEYDANTRITRVIDGGEPADFQSLFKAWKVPGQVNGLTPFRPQSNIAHVTQHSINAAALHESPKMAAMTQMVDDGSGQMEMWRINKFEMEEVPEEAFGEFYMGDCYITLYAYSAGDKEHFLIYYWLGVDSTQDEQATAAACSVDLDQKLEGRAVIVRVVQGKEPPHFLTIYNNKMIVFEGGYGSGFKNSGEATHSKKSAYMLHVRSNAGRTKAVECDLRGSSLNSNDCFIVRTREETFMWYGKGANGDERSVAKEVVGNKVDTTVAMEGKEPERFWELLGGREDYANDSLLAEEDFKGHKPRLFQCSNASGVFKADEVLNFSQEDLACDDVMLLDSWHSVFLWMGNSCNRTERVDSQKLALDYLRTDPSGRSPDTPILVIKQGFEPPNFTGFFGVWDNDLWNNNMSYADISERLAEENPGITVLVSSQTGENGDFRRTYSMAVLRIRDLDELPDEIDPTKKEDYLSDGDFEVEFGMTREDFIALPVWKQTILKKQSGIY